MASTTRARVRSSSPPAESAASPAHFVAAIMVAFGTLLSAFGPSHVLGSGLFLPSNTTVLLDGVPSNRMGIVNAVRLMLQNTGVVVGTALAVSVITIPLPTSLHDALFAGTLSHISPGAVPQLVTGYQWALACMTIIGVLTVVTCLGRRRVH